MKIDNLFNKKLDSCTQMELQQAVDELIEVMNTRGANPITLRNNVLHAQGIHCPHCSGHHCVLHEKTKRTRFKCRDCNKTFTSTYGTPLHGIHSVNKWQQFVPLFLQSKSIRFIAKALKISTRTAFDWRHKTLAALSENTWIGNMHGIVEIDALQFDFNQKGARTAQRAVYKGTTGRKKGDKLGEKITALVLHERMSNKTEMKIVQTGPMKKATLHQALTPKVCSAKTIVCSNTQPGFMDWARENHLWWEPTKATARPLKKSLFHLQNIQQNTVQFTNWHSRFNGVASKYLNNYLSWHNLLLAIKKHKNQIEKALTVILTPSTALHKYKNIPSDFETLYYTHVFAT